MNTLEYNTKRTKLIIPEYGRHIHQMIDQAVAQKDKEERNKMAKAIIGVMGNLNPHLRDVPDFQHKLWAQLFIMSDFQLDVESPYDKPSKEVYDIAEDTVKIGAKVLWLQLGIRDEKAKDLMEKNDIKYVENKCTKMEYQKYFLKVRQAFPVLSD